MYYVLIKIVDIYKAIVFYEKLGFIVCECFIIGYILVCWMEGLNSIIELI